METPPKSAAAAAMQPASATVDAPQEQLSELFKGIAVVIDDEITDSKSSIRAIVEQIRAGGCQVVMLEDIPADDESLASLKGASFFVMDWQLRPTMTADANGEVAAIKLPASARREEDNRKLKFLKRLAEERLAPMFIFTSEDTTEVKAVLKRESTLYVEGQPTHLLVEDKSNVLDQKVFVVLSEWLSKTPSALVLKSWEHEYERAKNDMFFDFYTKTVDWPVLLWKTFNDDGIPAGDELGRLITRIIFSRMTPFDCNLSEFVKPDPTDEAAAVAYRKKLMEVLEGERFVPKRGLHDNSIAPGDVFKVDRDYFINIRPDCDCIPRAGANDVELYVLRGRKARNAELAKSFDPDYGLVRERDNEAAIYGMYQGETVVFDLKSLEKKSWAEIKERRIGRLLPPFLTRLQQRYSSYLQRPGLPRIPAAAFPAPPASAPTAAPAPMAQPGPK